MCVVTDRYGVIESKIKRGFADEANSVEKKYKINEVPQEIINICHEIRGVGGRVLLVGGSVRDMVISQEHPDMKLKPKDFDLEVYGLSPEELQRVLETVFGSDKVDSVGRAFGVLKVKIDGWYEPLDFSIPRVDSKTGEGHHEFAITGLPDMTVKEAAGRRDITINSMAYDPLTETVYDPYGGVQDIKDKIIRMTDETAFQEDPLRVVRVMQFAARFGFEIDRKTEMVCKKMVENGELDFRQNTPGSANEVVVEDWVEGEETGFLVVEDGKISHRKWVEKTEPKGLPMERVAEELYKLLLKGKKPSLGFEFAQRIGLIALYWPELEVLKGKEQEKSWHPEGDVWSHIMQVMDVMVEIADRELAAGNIPTPEMWREMEELIRTNVVAKKKEFTQQLFMSEIGAVLGEEKLQGIIDEARNTAQSARDKHYTGLIRNAEIQAMGNAKTEFGGEKRRMFEEVGREEYDRVIQQVEQDILDELIKKQGQRSISETEMTSMRQEAREIRTTREKQKNELEIQEKAENILRITVEKDGQKWRAEANSIFIGTEVKEIRSLVETKIAEMRDLGVIDNSRVEEIEALAESMAVRIGEEERKKKTVVLKNNVKIVLVLAALCHDLGKATTTKFEDGKIRSKGHEQAGIAPMRKIFKTLYETRFNSNIKRMILPLIAEHLRPPEIWRDVNGIRREEGEVEFEVELKDQDPKKRLRRLAMRLANGDEAKILGGSEKKPVYPDGGGTDLYLLGLVAEADQRGRNPVGRPYTREEMEEMGELEWQKWWNEKIKETKIEKPIEKILKGDDLMSALKKSGKQGGAWVKVVIDCVEADMAEEMIAPVKEDALQAALDYYNRLSTYVKAQREMMPEDKQTDQTETDIWLALKSVDAREMIRIGAKSGE